MVANAKSRTTVAAAGSLTDVALGNAEAMVVSLGPSELTQVRRDDGIDGYQTAIPTL